MQSPPKPAAQPVPQPSKPDTDAPPVDNAKVTGSTFHSDFFKLTYELPKDWKAMDDAARMAANQRLRMEDQESSPINVSAPRKKTSPPRPAAAQNPAVAQIKPTPLDTYSLLVASPVGADSLGSAVLPRVNIWAHRRYPSLDSIGDHAQFLGSTRHIRVVIPPQNVTYDGHDFVRIDVIMPSGEYRVQLVTAVNDYLVGFEFHAASQEDSVRILDSLRSLKFQ